MQDLTGDSKMTGDHSASEEEDLPSVSDASGVPPTLKGGEAPEVKKESPAVVPPQRRASTPPPPTLTVKLLTRLGSLEGERISLILNPFDTHCNCTVRVTQRVTVYRWSVVYQLWAG